METQQSRLEDLARELRDICNELREVAARLEESSCPKSFSLTGWLRRLDSCLFSPPHTFQSVVSLVAARLGVPPAESPPADPGSLPLH
jgi:hypothetical protein